ncbi:MAG: ABC transporter ATP-binding protein, partial [Eubacterium sp.]|nr:ABC transporter ATP-binding protein [Eubacterium sp.]
MSPRPGGGPGGHGPGGPHGIAGGKPANTAATVGRLLKYLGKDVGFVITALICTLVFSGTTLAGSYLLAPIVDNITKYAKQYLGAEDVAKAAILAEGTTVLLKGVLVMLVVYGVGVLVNYLQQRIMIGVSQRALLRIRKELFDHLQSMPVRYFDTNSTGDIMSRFTNDVDMIGELMNNTVIQLISGIVNIVGTLAIMITMNLWLALLTILMTPVMFLAGGAIAKRSRKYYRDQQTALGNLNGFIEETVTGQKIVKVFCHENRAVDDFTELNDTLRDKQIKAQFVGGIMGPV